MKFKVDENMPSDTAVALRQAGYDAVSVVDQRLGGQADADIASVCQIEDRALVTLDGGFADVRSYPPSEYSGIIILALVRQDRDRILKTISRLIGVLEKEPLVRKLWIVEDWRIRIRS